jgi:hypothetical protein
MPPGSLREFAGIIDRLVEIAHCVEPMDHVAGRITMGVSLFNLPKVLSLIVSVDVDQSARSIPGIKGYEVSVWTMSATILYDPDVLPFELWRDFCSMRDNRDAEKSFRDRVVSLIENNSRGSGV